jgi:hypothetical protein
MMICDDEHEIGILARLLEFPRNKIDLEMAPRTLSSNGGEEFIRQAKNRTMAVY